MNAHENHGKVTDGKWIGSVGLHGVHVGVAVNDSSHHGESNDVYRNKLAGICENINKTDNLKR